MRRIICRFDDGPSFLKHYHRPAVGEAKHPGLDFLGDFGLSDGEIVRVAIIIAEPGERHDLHMRIEQRIPKLRSHTTGIRWRYRAVTTPADTPWLEMLAAKHTTARRISG